ncbi:MAG: MFS transporter [Pseudomonadota bacterium]
MTDASAQTQRTSDETPNAAYANYALRLLFVVMILNFLDRQIIAVLAEPVKRDLGLSDTQVGLMSGLSFSIFYTTLGLPIAALSDRWNRRRIIAISLTIWSTMTVLCGMAGNFVQLFLARVGVGVGEAGSGPASHSLIADLFPPERRASALGFYGMSIPIGAFIAYAGGGWVVENLGWRMAFVLAGAPGLLVAVVVMLTIREPRGTTPLSQVFKPDPTRVSLKDALAELSRKSAYWHLIASGAFVQFVAYGASSFYGSFFVRTHGMSYAEFGLKLGIMVGIVGAFASWIGGRWGDKLAQRSHGAPLYANAATMVLSVPIMIAGLNVADPNLAFVLFAAPTFAGTYYFGSTYAGVQKLARDETRAVAVAIYLLLASLIGLGLGPLFVGVLSDAFAGASPTPADEASALRSAITVLAFFNIWGGVHFWLSGRKMADDMTKEPEAAAA